MPDCPGVCFVTRGPGATNASIGVHTAFQESTPMVLFEGDVAGDACDREAFQEVDFAAFFGPATKGMAKRVERVDDARRIPDHVARAFAPTMNGRPGPVVLPKDHQPSHADQGTGAQAGAGADPRQRRNSAVRSPETQSASLQVPWIDWSAAAQVDHQANVAVHHSGVALPGPIDMPAIVQVHTRQALLLPDAVLTNGDGTIRRHQ